MSRPRIVLTIDRVVVDRPGLTREALAAALEAEIRRAVAERGPAALGTSRSLESAKGPPVSALPRGVNAAAVARATLGALGR